MNYWTKYIVKKIFRLTPQYYKYRRRILKRFVYNESDIYKIIKEVPFYKEKNYRPGKLKEYPLLSKKDIIENADKFLPKKSKRLFLHKISTSGTSGTSLNLYISINDIIKEEAFVSHAFSRIGSGLKIAVLRGNRPAKGIYEYKFGHLLLSSYLLSKENLPEYLRIIRKYKINCLHVYPSSIYIFCKYLQEIKEETNIEFPDLKGIFSSSEILTPETRKLIRNLFPNCTLIDQYGMSEHVAHAISINNGYYHFQEAYSIVELLDTGIRKGNNCIKEIVGTNMNNKSMPLIRYRTEDYVEVDKQGNIISILGRSNDFVVNIYKMIVPCTVVTRDDTLVNVNLLQHYQDKVGELVLRIETNEKFSDKDARNIVDDMSNCFQGLMHIKIEKVNEFERTNNGKLINLVQKLNLNDFK